MANKLPHVRYYMTSWMDDVGWKINHNASDSASYVNTSVDSLNDTFASADYRLSSLKKYDSVQKAIIQNTFNIHRE